MGFIQTYKSNWENNKEKHKYKPILTDGKYKKRKENYFNFKKELPFNWYFLFNIRANFWRKFLSQFWSLVQKLNGLWHNLS